MVASAVTDNGREESANTNLAEVAWKSKGSYTAAPLTSGPENRSRGYNM